MEEVYSLFNLDRTLLANFLMSAIKSSSSALVSEERGERRRREEGEERLLGLFETPHNHILSQFHSDRINTDTQEMTLSLKTLH